jgi:uncharacterized protein involved in exopolysaccharide biosynthesis
MKSEQIPSSADAGEYSEEDGGPQVGLVDLLTWLGQGKRLILGATLTVALGSLAYALTLPPIYTARASLLPPGAQQQTGSGGAALAALGSLGALPAGVSGKTPDELYVALLKSDSVTRALDEHFGLKTRYRAKAFETLRKELSLHVRISSEKKTSVITVEVDDEDPQFAADLANSHGGEVTKMLGRLAVSEAQQRRKFFEQQLKETKDNMVKAETALRSFQEKSGIIVLEKQSEALITGAAQVRSQIADREVRLKVMRTGATEQNPDVMQLSSELRALRFELARMESTQGGSAGSSVDIPVTKIPEASIDYVRARRELRLQETLLDTMVRQLEAAKLDEAKEGPLLQEIDHALPPDYKSKPSRSMIVLVNTLVALLASAAWVVARRYAALTRTEDPAGAMAWREARRAWSLRA